MSDPAIYTIGWICSLRAGYVAAQELLDEEHEEPAVVAPNDTNNYTLGQIGRNNVVITVLPEDHAGTASAATVAAKLLNSFPNVQIGVSVGIGGGVPSEEHDIRLGDVVVSAPRNGKGGVLQYDFGKQIQGQGFHQTLFLNQPPTTLRTAVIGVCAQYRRRGHRITETIKEIMDRNTRLLPEYGRPEPSADRLFKADVIHDPRGCAEYCMKMSSSVIPRRERMEFDENPAIHYGLVASGNRSIQDALLRDQLARENDVLCFENDAAGLMNTFPCLVIRGICDYADSHRSKEWQGYAAMVAAVYAKDLFRRINPTKVDVEKRIGHILSDLQDVAQTHRTIAEQQLHMQERIFQQMLSDQKEECLKLFRRTSSTEDTTYEWYKGRVQDRVKGTCEWFLNHDHFRTWLEQKTGPLLVTADPGCGKSVLAKYLIDQGLPRSATICFFFFQNQDQNTIRQALCALLHQLFLQKPFLVKYAMEEFAKNGRGLVNSTWTLWTILEKAVQELRAGPIIMVLDALDECVDSEMEALIRRIESQFRGYQIFPWARIPGEDESGSIIREAHHVIRSRVERLAKDKRLADPAKGHLERRLLKVPHRTYLWVHLVFNYLTTEPFKKTVRGIDSALANLSASINEAYERILRKSNPHPKVRRVFSIILAASRPLTVSEMNVALNVDDRSKSIHDLDLEEDENFWLRLRDGCGLLISIDHNQIFFLHPSVREFLLSHQASVTNLLKSRWQDSITIRDAHTVFGTICVYYLVLFNNDPLPTEADRKGSGCLNHNLYALLEYSSNHWSTHYREAAFSPDAEVTSSTLRICCPDSPSWSVWFTGYSRNHRSSITQIDTGLMAVSYLGLEGPASLLLAQGTDCNPKDANGRTPLSWAAENGHEDVVRLLLTKGADYRSADRHGQTPLSWAVKYGREGVIKLLLDKGADFKIQHMNGQSTLS
ncbi:purine and uridine phosphorylase [Aspergillus taichungensis]|uniref:Purine and uridine phosphorylase n=1 Tax=Aspergillus taichungensis TaxID=482145 RepID=A0A2J5HNL3_9EURO|nr:purine and uridine phosphorylase [Aspergillus taichungensis]